MNVDRKNLMIYKFKNQIGVGYIQIPERQSSAKFMLHGFLNKSALLELIRVLTMMKL